MQCTGLRGSDACGFLEEGQKQHAKEHVALCWSVLLLLSLLYFLLFAESAGARAGGEGPPPPPRRPTLCQKRPTLCRKRPTSIAITDQKRPTDKARLRLQRRVYSQEEDTTPWLLL